MRIGIIIKDLEKEVNLLRLGGWIHSHMLLIIDKIIGILLIIKMIGGAKRMGIMRAGGM
jgi:hypothetical protein